MSVTVWTRGNGAVHISLGLSISLLLSSLQIHIRSSSLLNIYILSLSVSLLCTHNIPVMCTIRILLMSLQNIDESSAVSGCRWHLPFDPQPTLSCIMHRLTIRQLLIYLPTESKLYHTLHSLLFNSGSVFFIFNSTRQLTFFVSLSVLFHFFYNRQVD